MTRFEYYLGDLPVVLAGISFHTESTHPGFPREARLAAEQPMPE